MKIEVKRFNVTEFFVSSENAEEISLKLKQLKEEGFSCENIQTGYENGKEESEVYWFKAVKKVSLDTVFPS